jgi:CheY-like chemotaxis protein
MRRSPVASALLFYYPVMEDERAQPEESDLIAAPGVACQTSSALDATATRLPSRALVVDDSLVVADVVTSVDRALEHVAGVPYDLVVCDVCMPDGGGPAVYYATIARPPDLASRFLFITGNVDDPGPWRFLAKIRAHVLEKPFTGRTLRSALIKVIA